MGRPLTSQVTIIAVGVSNYQYMDLLPGPLHDVERLRELLVESKRTALFNENQFVEILDPTAAELRDVINDYASSVSRPGAILLFYFSGHGTPIGNYEFGFCTIDTKPHPESGVILPLSVVKFSDLVLTLSTINITPIIVIDACYSGRAGHALEISSFDLIQYMRNEIHTQHASKYALLTSCTDYQTAIDTSVGGIFSHYLIEVASGVYPSGNNENMYLNLQDIFPELENRVMNYSDGEVTPRLYLGHTLPKFDLVKNVNYSPRVESLAPYQIRILKALWNRGNSRELRPGEIGALCGPGAYGNHSKLTLKPWGLVETNPHTSRRRLTERGKKFVKGDLTVPKKIEVDRTSGDWVPATNTEYVGIADFSEE